MRVLILASVATLACIMQFYFSAIVIEDAWNCDALFVDANNNSTENEQACNATLANMPRCKCYVTETNAAHYVRHSDGMTTILTGIGCCFLLAWEICFNILIHQNAICRPENMHKTHLCMYSLSGLIAIALRPHLVLQFQFEPEYSPTLISDGLFLAAMVLYSLNDNLDILLFIAFTCTCCNVARGIFLNVESYYYYKKNEQLLPVIE